MVEIILRTHCREHGCGLVSRVVDHRPSHMLDLHAVNWIIIPTQADPMLKTHRANECIDTKLLWLVLPSTPGSTPAM